MNKFKHVDALRGIAVLLVVLVHFGQRVPSGQIFGLISKFGQYGVQLFFVMSAFTLCHSMRKTDELNPRGYFNFMIRRFFRIAPLYYLAIPVYFLFSYLCLQHFGKTPFAVPADYTLKAVLSNVFFIHGLYQPGNNNIVPGGWSIGAEFLFYATFPFLFIWAKRRRIILGYAALAAFLATFILVLLRWKFGRIGEFGMSGFIYFSVFNQFPCFALGMLYYFYSRNNFFESGMKIMAPLSAISIVILHDRQWGMLFTPLCAGICSVGVALYLENSRIPNFISRLGQLSFSIYIIHFIPVWIFGKIYQSYFPLHLQGELISLIIFIFVAGITYAISLISNRFVELPFIAIGQKFSDKTKSTEPNQALQRTTMLVTDCAPSSTLRAKHGRR
jgi:peptidoglycan/LPS O-acetylase OafA/YrhL